MYCKEKKCMTLCITMEESDLFERVSKYLRDITKRMKSSDLTTLTNSNGDTVCTQEEVQTAWKVVNQIALAMEIDNRGNKKEINNG